jgi:hypothetical protein
MNCWPRIGTAKAHDRSKAIERPRWFSGGAFLLRASRKSVLHIGPIVHPAFRMFRPLGAAEWRGFFVRWWLESGNGKARR